MKTSLPILIIALFSHFWAAAQQRFYVNHSATGSNNGLSWIDAYTDLQSAMFAAQEGDEIWVAKGTYLPDSAADRHQTFLLASGARLLGGFAGTEQSASERDPQAHITILSGNIGNPTDSTDNSFSILYLDHPNEQTFVSGFTLEHGYAQSDTSFGNVSPFRAGGAVYVLANDSFAYPVFDRCVFKNNYAGGNGGAVMVRGRLTKGCAPRFISCVFENNSCGNNGGAVWLQGGSEMDKGIEFYNCSFLNNRAGNILGSLAGGVYYWKVVGTDTLEFKNCSMIGNTARGIAGFLNVECSVPEKYVFIDSCYVSKNFVPGNDGANIAASFAHFEGSGNFSVYRKIRIANNVFDDQPGAKNGYIIYNNHNYHELNRYEVKGNKFQNSKGVISFNSAAQIVFSDNVFLDSILVGLRGVYINVSNNQFLGEKSRITVSSYEPNSKFYIFNNFIKNSATPDKYYSWRDDVLSLSNYEFKDTIYLFNNTIMNTWFRPPTIFTNPASTIKIYAQNNIFLNNYNAETGEKCLPFWHEIDQLDFDYNITDFGCSTLTGQEVLCGDHNIVVTDYPFVDTAAGDYHLRPCAAGLNAGSADFYSLVNIPYDLGGNIRFQGIAPDIGPFEHIPEVIQASFTTSASCGAYPTGSFSFTSSGGCPPYTVLWSGPDSTVGQNTDQLATGDYSVTISDASQHIFTTHITITANDTLLIPPPFIADAGSNGAANGAILIIPAGGLPPYTAIWDDGSTGMERTQLTAGAYTVTVTDQQGCTTSGTYQVGTVGVQDPDQTSVFQIWPNPAKEVLYISGNDIQSVEILDIMGRQVFSTLGNSGMLFTINTASFLPGTYYLKINGGACSKRVVVGQGKS